MTPPGWTVAAEPVGSEVSRRLLWRYFAEIVSRYHGRPCGDDEIAQAVADDPSDHLVLPAGQFLVARLRGEAVGCAGVKLLEPGIAEMKRVFVDPAARGSGGGGVLIGGAEDAARSLGAEVVRLDTRNDLVEARALYAKHGYAEIPAYNDGPYAEHWFEKVLSSRP